MGRTLVGRTESLAARVTAFNNDPAHSSRIRVLGADDLDSLQELSMRVTEATPFFSAVFGLSPTEMAHYWTVLNRELTASPESLILGLEADGKLQAVISLCSTRFPGMRGALRLVIGLALRLGLRSFLSYWRGVIAYERLLKLEGDARSRTLRGLWFYVAPSAQHQGYGWTLGRFVTSLVGSWGFSDIQGACDGENEKLRAFYTSHGARFLRSGESAGLTTVEFRVPTPGKDAK
jgi:GNAT superfamily N-acetyltransferase